MRFTHFGLFLRLLWHSFSQIQCRFDHFGLQEQLQRFKKLMRVPIRVNSLKSKYFFCLQKCIKILVKIKTKFIVGNITNEIPIQLSIPFSPSKLTRLQGKRVHLSKESLSYLTHAYTHNQTSLTLEHERKRQHVIQLQNKNH